MQDSAEASPKTQHREPWNKGRLIGAKPPLRPKHVWSIRTKLQVEGQTRDLALFNLAIDSKLRGCDVVALKVEDVAPSGYALDRATVRQKKTGQPVRFEMSEQTRQAVDDYIRAAGKKPGEVLFAGRRGPWAMHDDAAIRPSRLGLDRQRWVGPEAVRNTFFAPNEGDADLSPNWKSASGAIAAWAHQDREYRAPSRHRNRRRPCHSGTS
jgi:integrase